LHTLRDVARRRRALITGIDGQDGSYLAEQLVDEGCAVTGMVRHADAREAAGLAAVRDRVDFVTGDLLDARSLHAAVRATAPDELYHLAAPTFVPESWEDPS
jgi:GDPmannose 4,6-dehydratase